MTKTDPIFCLKNATYWDAGAYDPGWYFWDETWAYAHGPFSTKDEAQKALNHYCATELAEAPAADD